MRYVLIGAVRAYLLIPRGVRHRACARVGRTKPTARTALAGLRAGQRDAIRSAISTWDECRYRG